MSDYFDILKSAKEKGILLDSCGTDERQYWNGLYNDLCGMSVEDAMAVQYWHEGGGSSSKKSNTITFEMKASGSSQYELVLTPSAAPTASVNASFILDDTQHTVVIPAGSLSYSTGILKSTKYADLKNIALSSEDETYTYKSNNNVRNGNFNLTYISAIGEIISTQAVKYGTTVTIPGVPTEYQVGYDYYWHYQGSETPISGTFVMPEKDVTIVGTATIHTWTITYKIEGEPDVVKTYNYGATIVKYIPEVKEGREFSGWDDEEPATMPDNALVFMGEYVPLTYTLKYIVNDAEYSSITYEYNELITPIENPEEREGYTFSGWSEIPERMPAHNVDVRGNYTINTYSITYHIDGLEDVVKRYQYGAQVIPYVPVMEGHTFQGWDIEEPATMPAQNLTRNGEFTANVYYITYYINGEQYKQESHNFGATITIAEEPSKEGYTFSGWDEELPATMPSHNIDIHGSYTINTYKLAYFVDNVKVDEETYEYNQVISAKTEPTKEGYTFSGWGTIPSVMPAHNVEVRGTFSINTYSLTYKVDGEDYYTARCEYNSAVEVLPAPSKEGYTFSGWSEIPSKMPAYDLIITGSFSINSYILSYKIDGALYSSLTVEYNTVITPIAEPEPRVGYTFTGWVNVPERMPASNVDVLGTFEANSYILEYYVDGELHNMESYVYKQPIDPVAAPEKTGYDFVKWENLPETMPANDVRVDALYRVHQWVATYNISGEGTYTAITYNYGATIVDPVPPARSGYTFAWESHPTTMPDNNITINGEYSEIKESTLVYYAMDLNDKLSAITPEQIAAYANYDGLVNKEKETSAIIPASEECTEYFNNRENAETDEEYDYWDAKYNQYMDEHLYAYSYAIPSTLTLNGLYIIGAKITDGISEVGHYNIGGQDYTLWKYCLNNKSFKQNEKNKEYKLTIKIN